MKPTRFALALAFGLAATTAAQAGVVDLSFSSVDNAKVKVTGDGSKATISFLAGTDSQDFRITNASAPGDAVNLTGVFTGSPGTFSYLLADVTNPILGVEVADPLTSNGLGVKIGSDAAGYLTADVTSSAITRIGASGQVNTELVVNLANASYTVGTDGTNDNLSRFAQPGVGSFQLSFSLGSSNITLAGMTASGFDQTFGSYSGNMSAVPEPGSLVLTALVAAPLVGLTYRRRRRKTD